MAEQTSRMDWIEGNGTKDDRGRGEERDKGREGEDSRVVGNRKW
jgi:hypothetical protein